MDPAPAPNFEVLNSDRGRIYRLPRRRLGWLHLLALIPSGAVALMTVCLVKLYLIRGAVGLPADWFLAGFVVVLVFWAFMTYTMLDLAGSLLCGQSEIRIAPDGMVAAYDRAGWFSICVSWFHRGTAGRLILEECATPDEAHRSIWSWFFLGLWQLTAEGKNGSRGWLALGYPRAILAALAKQLAPQLAVAPPDAFDAVQSEVATAPTPEDAAPVPVVAEQAFPNRDTPEPPLNTRVTVERHPNGITITVPRTGLSGKILEPFCLGAFIAALFLSLTIATVVSWIIKGNLEFPPGLVLGPGFSAVGIGIMLYWLNIGRKKTVLAVVGDKLLAFETGPLGSRRHEFAGVEILDVACKPNDNIPDLRIITHDGKVVWLLSGRYQMELKWIATLLRQALGIPSEPPEHRKPNRPPQPWDKTTVPGTPPPS